MHVRTQDEDDRYRAALASKPPDVRVAEALAMAGLSEENAPSRTVDTPVEYALYALAVHYPVLFREAEQFVGGMLANDQDALRCVKALLR